MSIRNLFTYSLILIAFSSCQFADKNESQIEQPLASLTDTYWKLVELEEQKVTMSATQKKEAYFILHNQDKRIVGFNGCNRFFGEFESTELSEGQGQLTFSAFGATKMACKWLAVSEQRVMRLFNNQVNYQIQGETLVLLDKESKIVAKFNAVYF